MVSQLGTITAVKARSPGEMTTMLGPLSLDWRDQGAEFFQAQLVAIIKSSLGKARRSAIA
jgi:hypothetical protein